MDFRPEALLKKAGLFVCPKMYFCGSFAKSPNCKRRDQKAVTLKF